MYNYQIKRLISYVLLPASFAMLMVASITVNADPTTINLIENIDFSSYDAETVIPTKTVLGKPSTNIGGLSMGNNNGNGGLYTVKDAVYGKLAGDKSLKTEPIASGNDYLQRQFNGLNNASNFTVAKGDVLRFKMQVAHEDMKLHTNVTFNFLNSSNAAVNFNGNQFAISMNYGTQKVSFFGSNIPMLLLNEKWYDIDIVMELGTLVSTDEDDVPTKAYCYIDGKLIDLREYSFKSSNVAKINMLRIEPTHRITDASTNAANIALYDCVYLDNISFVQYKEAIGAPTHGDCGLTSTNNAVIEDAGAFIVPAGITKQELLAGLSVPGGTVDYISKDFGQTQNTDAADNGFLKLTDAAGQVYYRGVVNKMLSANCDNLNTYNRDKANNGMAYNFVASKFYATNTTGTFVEGFGGKTAEDYSYKLTNTYNTSDNPWLSYFYPLTAKLNVSTFEYGLYLTTTEKKAELTVLGPGLSIVLGSDDIGKGKWAKVAVKIDYANQKYTTYVNGKELSSQTKTFTNTNNITEFRLKFNVKGINDEGFAAFDNVKYYYGAYDPSKDLIILESEQVTVNKEKKVLIAQPSMPVNDFVSALDTNGTAKVYTDNSFTTVNEGTIANGNVLVLISPNGEVLEYYDVLDSELVAGMPEFIRRIDDEGIEYIKAKVSIENFSETSNSVLLIMTSYKGNQLIGIRIGEGSVSTVSDVETEEMIYDETAEIKAFVVKDFGSLKPLGNFKIFDQE